MPPEQEATVSLNTGMLFPGHKLALSVPGGKLLSSVRRDSEKNWHVEHHLCIIQRKTMSVPLSVGQ